MFIVLTASILFQFCLCFALIVRRNSYKWIDTFFKKFTGREQRRCGATFDRADIIACPYVYIPRLYRIYLISDINLRLYMKH